MRPGVVVALALLISTTAACGQKRSKTETPAEPEVAPAEARSPEAFGDLWRLEPTDAALAVVVRGPAATQLASAIGFVLEASDGLAVGDVLRAELDVLRGLLVAPLPADADWSRGAALFLTASGDQLLALPAGDPKAYLARDGLDARCRPIGHWVACAADEALLEPAAERRSLGSRFDGASPVALEAAVQLVPLFEIQTDQLNPGFAATVDAPLEIRGQLDDDGLELDARFAVPHPNPRDLSGVSTALGTELVRSGKASGFFRIAVPPESFPLPPSDVMPGLSVQDLAHAFTGELIAYTPTSPDWRQVLLAGIDDAAVVKRALPTLCKMAGALPPVSVTRATPPCEGTVDLDSMSSMAPGMGKAGGATWTARGESDRLQVNMGEEYPRAAPPMGERAAELVEGGWWFAAYARGSSLSQFSRGMSGVPIFDLFQLASWLSDLLYEIGLGHVSDEQGVRLRMFARPYRDDGGVALDHARLKARLASGDADARQGLATLVADHPDSEVAIAAELGPHALTSASAGIGMLAAVILPSIVR